MTKAPDTFPFLLKELVDGGMPEDVAQRLLAFGAHQGERIRLRLAEERDPNNNPEMFEYFYCTCGDTNREEAWAMHTAVLDTLAAPPEDLLTAVVQSLNWDFDAMITALPNDQWSAVIAETYDHTFRTYIQCDRVEHGVAGTWRAFADRFPDKFQELKR